MFAKIIFFCALAIACICAKPQFPVAYSAPLVAGSPSFAYAASPYAAYSAPVAAAYTAASPLTAAYTAAYPAAYPAAYNGLPYAAYSSIVL
ncbi:cuticle protein 38-like [Ochlerotatus camptorhynchus]|uniref:cuticle protein 38-like n=1 Tax=Ochlerotatus camptorhynchus TaxID=644619 RepID=UPI0031D08C26